MAGRFVIRHKVTGEFLGGRGWERRWVPTLDKARLYVNAGAASQSVSGFEPGSFEYVPARITLEPHITTPKPLPAPLAEWMANSL